jgi:hypothetical protein
LQALIVLLLDKARKQNLLPCPEWEGWLNPCSLEEVTTHSTTSKKLVASRNYCLPREELLDQTLNFSSEACLAARWEGLAIVHMGAPSQTTLENAPTQAH